MKKLANSGISRRTFLKGAAALGAVSMVGTGGGVALAEGENTPEEAEEVPAWLGKAPDITDDMVGETWNAKVVIIGAGVAGISAARSATETMKEGVCVLEATDSITMRGHTFGCLNSTFQKKLGCEYDPQEVVNEICVSMGNRVNALLWKKWADESGDAFDWFESQPPRNLGRKLTAIV